MRKFLSRMWHEQDGVLSFEWTMLASLLTVGVVAGVSSLRDGMIDEMGDLTRAMTSLDQSYRVQGPLVISVHTPDFGSGNGGSYRVYNYRGGTTQGLHPGWQRDELYRFDGGWFDLYRHTVANLHPPAAGAEGARRWPGSRNARSSRSSGWRRPSRLQPGSVTTHRAAYKPFLCTKLR